MSLVSGTEIIKIAEDNDYAIGGFDCYNMESAQSIIMAANEMNTPVFLQVCVESMKWMGFEYAIANLITAAKQASVPIAVHFDHGPEVSKFNQIKECIDYGFTSVMVDGSKLPYNENVNLTNSVVKYAHNKNVAVEGEIGKVSREKSSAYEDLKCLMTDPKEAVEFISKTNIDYLAVSVGSVHGFYEGTLKFDYQRLKKIREMTNMPLVLHGGTGIPDEQLKKLVKNGIRKVNIATGIRKAFLDSLRKELNNNPKEVDPRKVLDAARYYVKENVKNYIRILIDIKN